MNRINVSVKRPVSCSILSYSESILLSTPFIRWYLQQGLIVNEIHEVLKYDP